MGKSVGLVLIGLGLLAIVVGSLMWLGALSWFGRLPGDIHIEGERSDVYIPITSMVLVSLVLSATLWVARRLFE